MWFRVCDNFLVFEISQASFRLKVILVVQKEVSNKNIINFYTPLFGNSLG